MVEYGTSEAETNRDPKSEIKCPRFHPSGPITLAGSNAEIPRNGRLWDRYRRTILESDELVTISMPFSSVLFQVE